MRIHRTEIIKTSHHRAFTLIEILVVITIIALLIGLLIPAVQAVMNNVRIAQVRSEITSLEGALADFKAKYGVYPPSSITLHNETGIGNGDALTQWDADAASKAKIIQIWPDFDFSTPIVIDDSSGTPKLLWEDGTKLQGAECLVFFLGGIPRADGSYDLNGFSNNPENPFLATGNSRTGPFFEFDISRLTPSVVATGTTTTPLVYKDTIPGQTNPYVYASSYDGRGYQSADVTGYLSGGPYTQASGGNWKSKTFQLISPGFGYSLGSGGLYDPSSASSLGTNDQDNITNFSNGELGG